MLTTFTCVVENESDVFYVDATAFHQSIATFLISSDKWPPTTRATESIQSFLNRRKTRVRLQGGLLFDCAGVTAFF